MSRITHLSIIEMPRVGIVHLNSRHFRYFPYFLDSLLQQDASPLRVNSNKPNVKAVREKLWELWKPVSWVLLN